MIQDGERDRLSELWEQVEKFVALQAGRRFLLSGGLGGVEADDLYQSGYIALVAAADTYNPTAGRSFIGWLALALKTAFAEAGGYRSERQVRDPLQHAGSLDAPIGGDEESDALGCLIPDPGAAQAFQDVEDRIYQEQLQTAIEKALDQLPEDERAVLRARYYEDRTWKEIGPKARALGERAIIHLRRPQIRRELGQYIEQRTPYLYAGGRGCFPAFP